MTRCLVIDVGNTSTSLGVVQDGRVGRVARVPTAGVTRRAAAAALGRLAGRRAADGAVLACVVPAAARAWQAAAREVTGRPALVVTAGLRFDVAVDYPRPGTIGADRLVNAGAAAARYGAPLVVADIGTAATVDVVSPAGAFVGGVILPGPAALTGYLAERTALLPALDPRSGGRVTGWGRSTRGAMLAGVRTGYRGMLREVVREVRAQPGMRRAPLVLTGGYGAWAARVAGLACRVDDDLTLFGLWRAWVLNMEAGATARG